MPQCMGYFVSAMDAGMMGCIRERPGLKWCTPVAQHEAHGSAQGCHQRMH